MKRLYCGGIIAIILLLNRTGLSQILYSITDVGTLGGVYSQATGINDYGQVVGYSTMYGGTDAAFVYCNGTITNLGTLGGTSAEALAINNDGQIVGASTPGINADYEAFLYSNGTMTSLGTVPGQSQSLAVGINDSGQIAVDEYTADNAPQAFLYSSGNLLNLGALPGQSQSIATGINNSGEVVGYSQSPGADEAFLYSSGTMTNLGTLGGGNGADAISINDNGQVVGVASNGAGAFHAFLYANGSMTDLGTLGGVSRGAAINASGEIVGNFDVSSVSTHGFVYLNGQMIDLNSLLPANSGWTVTSANAINSLGQIAADALDANDQEHAILMTPVSVPIPTQAPLAAIFPSTSSLYTPTITTFVNNNSGQFDSPTRQLLVADTTPATIQQNSLWKQSAVAVGSKLETTSQLVDIIFAGQSAGDAAEYAALYFLPPKYSNFASEIDIGASIGVDIATAADPVADLIAANSFIYGTLVAPQLVSLGQDPYDPDYKDPVVITGFPVLGISTAGDSLTATLSREFCDETHAASYLQAANTAANRYSSALQNSDSIDATMQLESVLYYLGLYRSAMAETQSDFNAVNSLLPSSEISNIEYDPNDLATLQAEIEQDGLPSSTVDFLTSLGLSASDINQVEQNILALDPDSFSGNLYGELDSGAAALDVPEPASPLLLIGIALSVGLRRNRKIIAA